MPLLTGVGALFGGGGRGAVTVELPLSRASDGAARGGGSCLLRRLNLRACSGVGGRILLICTTGSAGVSAMPRSSSNAPSQSQSSTASRETRGRARGEATRRRTPFLRVCEGEPAGESGPLGDDVGEVAAEMTGMSTGGRDSLLAGEEQDLRNAARSSWPKWAATFLALSPFLSFFFSSSGHLETKCWQRSWWPVEAATWRTVQPELVMA
mmetsp:Transcript_3674/g.12960  ORF Transcript_3674/g.12960 Transcript_3674/m.12960 type:complete len:210 (+) Transcript_3674:2189-2818(+)